MSVVIANIEDQIFVDNFKSSVRKKKRQLIIDRIAAVLTVAILWELITRLNIIDPFFISMPSRIVVDIRGMFSTGFIFPHLGVTLYETLVGLVLGTALGIFAGILLGYWNRLSEAVQPILIAFNSMPRVAIAPLFIIWFGFGVTSKIGLATIVVFFAVFWNTFAGLKSQDPVLVKSINSMGGSHRGCFKNGNHSIDIHLGICGHEKLHLSGAGRCCGWGIRWCDVWDWLDNK